MNSKSVFIVPYSIPGELLSFSGSFVSLFSLNSWGFLGWFVFSWSGSFCLWSSFSSFCYWFSSRSFFHGWRWLLSGFLGGSFFGFSFERNFSFFSWEWSARLELLE